MAESRDRKRKASGGSGESGKLTPKELTRYHVKDCTCSVCVIGFHPDDCNCEYCLHGWYLSPLREQLTWPEALPPDSDQVAKFFDIHPTLRDEFFLWVAAKMRLPSQTPRLLRNRETVVRTSFGVGGNVLELFRAYANENKADNGLLFKDISVSTCAARELVKQHRDVLDLIKTHDDVVRFYCLNEIVV
jgi:hypothetical protein